jgi:TPR repeat protein
MVILAVAGCAGSIEGESSRSVRPTGSGGTSIEVTGVFSSLASDKAKLNLKTNHSTPTTKLAMKRTIHNAAVGLMLMTSITLLNRPARAGLQEGVAAYEAGNLPLAVKEFRTAAEANDANCQYNLALMYERGIGVAKDEKEARVWYRKAAEQGNSEAQFNLGVLYENGRGGGVDFAEANQWYRKAAAQGDALAIGNLGMLYIRGDGVKVDKVAGVALLLQSATLDSSPENHAKRNIATTRGLTRETITAAQKLASEMSDAKNLLATLDQHIKSTSTNAAVGVTNAAAVKTNAPVKGN